MESLQVPASPHDYAGLGSQTRGARLDRHGYIEVIADVEYGGHPQVCMDIHYLCSVIQF